MIISDGAGAKPRGAMLARLYIYVSLLGVSVAGCCGALRLVALPRAALHE